MANQSHVAPVGARLSEVCRKDCVQLGRQTERGKVSWAPARRKETQTRREGVNFLPDPHIFTHRVLVRFGKSGGIKRTLDINALYFESFTFLEGLAIKILSVVDVKSGRRFNTEPEECIQLGQQRACVSGDVQPALSGSPCFSTVSST